MNLEELEKSLKNSAVSYRNKRERLQFERGNHNLAFLNNNALDEVELAYFNGEKHVLADLLSFGVLLMVNSMNNAETTCKSCKYRAEDGHLFFPDCWDNHKEENRKEGKGCPYYRFDESIL